MTYWLSVYSISHREVGMVPRQLGVVETQTTPKELTGYAPWPFQQSPHHEMSENSRPTHRDRRGLFARQGKSDWQQSQTNTYIPDGYSVQPCCSPIALTAKAVAI